MTPSEARALFPVLERIVYLNAGTFGPLATPTIAAVQAELTRDATEGRSGMPYFLRVLELREQARAALGALVGVPGESVALTSSTTDGCNTVTGPYTLGSDGAFKVGDLAGTQKACPSPADTRHIDPLKAATKVGLDDRSGYDQLVFTDASGALVLVLQDAAGG